MEKVFSIEVIICDLLHVQQKVPQDHQPLITIP